MPDQKGKPSDNPVDVLPITPIPVTNRPEGDPERTPDNPARQAKDSGRGDEPRQGRMKLNPNFDPTKVTDDPSTWAVPDKYRTNEDLFRGKLASDQEAVNMAGEIRDLRSMIEELRGQPAQPAAPQGPSEEEILGGIAQSFEEAGLDKSVTNAIKQLIALQVGAGVSHAVGPLIRGAEAHGEMLRDDSGYASRQSAVMAFVNSRPRERAIYQRLLKSDPYAAMVYADSAYQRTTYSALTEAEEGFAAERQHARTHGQVPTRGYHAEQPGVSGETDRQWSERVQEAWDRSSGMGDYMPYLRARLDDETLFNMHPDLRALASGR